jgi:hypothetical protein
VPGRVRRWRDGWRGEAIDMRSPLPIEEARARLQAGVTSLWSADPGGLGDRRVVGWVRDDGRVRLAGRYAMVRNSWRPVARGELRPEGTGCRLTGTLRAPLPVLVFSAIWLGGVGVFFLIGLLATIVALATGHAREAGGPAAVAAAGVGLFGSGAGLVGGCFALGRRDGDFLLDWLAGELEVVGYGGPSRSRPPE